MQISIHGYLSRNGSTCTSLQLRRIIGAKRDIMQLQCLSLTSSWWVSIWMTFSITKHLNGHGYWTLCLVCTRKWILIRSVSCRLIQVTAMNPLTDETRIWSIKIYLTNTTNLCFFPCSTDWKSEVYSFKSEFSNLNCDFLFPCVSWDWFEG